MKNSCIWFLVIILKLVTITTAFSQNPLQPGTFLKISSFDEYYGVSII